MTERLILDCDPGHDDALAMILACGRPARRAARRHHVRREPDDREGHAQRAAVCAIAGIDVPVAAGAAGPMVRPQIVAPDIHGESGLDGPVLPEPTRELDPRHAVDLIIDLVMANEPGTITLVPTGPLTNIALAMDKEPRIVERVKRVVLMGGAYTRGNRTPAAEFNIVADPEAAHAVFAGAWPVTMVGLDLTHQATADPEVVERIAAIDSPLSRFVVDLLRSSARPTSRGRASPRPRSTTCAASRSSATRRSSPRATRSSRSS